MPDPPQPSRGGGLSLYANLLDPPSDSSATISSGPVRYDQGADIATAAKKPLDPSLRFQPIRRPQVKSTKPTKPAFPKTIPAPVPSAGAPASASAPVQDSSASAPERAPGASSQKSTLANWTATEDDEWRYGLGEKRQRGGRKKKRKKNENHETDWDELYDPTKPTNVDEYLRSDERIREVQDWKAVLYRHRRRKSLSDDSDDDERRPANNQFAPPPTNYAFAPPPASPPTAVPAPPPPPDDSTAEDVYTRRLASSGAAPPPPTAPSPSASPPPPLPSEPGAATISRAPVRYAQPDRPRTEEDTAEPDGDSPPPTLGLGADPSAQTSEPDAPRSLRPGQAGFAQRLMSKYGWKKGTGLGVDESGIVNPLRVQVEKRKKKADAEGGGWAEPANKAKILGGRRKDDGASRFGPMSDCIVLRRMLEGMPDLQSEIENGLGQEIGEECGEKYGRVERLYIDVENRQVFIKFTNQVSALRAVSELDGRVFNGNAVAPSFYDAEKFEAGLYM